jgi:VWFA-related protein
LLFPSAAPCQTPPSAQVSQEISSSEAPFTFESKVNLVLVPVVIRDKNGKAVGSLRKEDFELRDRGKTQEILRFSIEHSGQTPKAPGSPDVGAAQPTDRASQTPPARFVAYLFDDIHGDAGDLVRSRAAAERNIQKTLSPSERIAVFTTTGSVSLDFTNDLAKAHEALRRIAPHRSQTEDCPDENYYMADLIRNKNDLQTLALATAEAEQCLSLPAGPAQNVAINTAVRILATGDEDTRSRWTPSTG